MDYQIKLSIPHLSGRELELTADAVASTWITPLGPYVDRFEAMLENYLCEGKKVVALSSGTAAIHLGLLLSGVKPGDEVICQSFTFAASANPIVYIGARPVFVDSEPMTWNIDPILLDEAIVERHAVTGCYPAAIVVVHLYGMPAAMDAICAVADKYGIPIVEDAAEAIGSRYKGRMCGTFGRFGVLSFNGNKMITTSGGGALICPDEASARRAKFLATQARENRPYYYHETIGYNYRLSNVSAAIGCAQMEVLAARVERRRAICELYQRIFKNNVYIDVHVNPSSYYESNYWLTTITLRDNSPLSPDQLRCRLAEAGIESRLLWRPMHLQPVYADATKYINGTSQKLFDSGLCLPSSTTLSDEQITRVADTIVNLLS